MFVVKICRDQPVGGPFVQKVGRDLSPLVPMVVVPMHSIVDVGELYCSR